MTPESEPARGTQQMTATIPLGSTTGLVMLDVAAKKPSWMIRRSRWQDNKLARRYAWRKLLPIDRRGLASIPMKDLRFWSTELLTNQPNGLIFVIGVTNYLLA